MSVWFTETFRGQILWDAARLRALDETIWEKFARNTDIKFDGGKLEATGEFDEVMYPSGTTAELLEANNPLRAEFKRIFFHSARETTRLGKNGKVTEHLTNENIRFRVGLPAVYGVFRDIIKQGKNFMHRESIKQNAFVGTFLEHAFRAQVGIMKSTPVAAMGAFARMDMKAVNEANRWQIIANEMRNLVTLRWKSMVSQEARGIWPKDNRGNISMTNWCTTSLMKLPEDWVVYFDGWLTFIQTPEMEESEFYALSTVDLDRLQQMCISMSMFELHQATWTVTAGNSVAEYIAGKRRLMKIYVDALDKCAKEPDIYNANNLCRDLRKIFNTYLSMSAGKLSDEGTIGLLNDIKKKKYDHIVSSRAYLNVLCAMPFDIAQDLGRLYKLLPAPDYDIGQSFVARQKQHLSMNKLHPIGGENPCNIDEFKKYFRKLLILTLCKYHGNKGVGRFRTIREPRWWKEYVKNATLPERLDAVDDIDLRGVAPYVERGPESVSAWKDSAVCEESLDDVMEDQPANTKRRNMLLRFLYDRTCPDADKARQMLTRKEHVHRVGFKMEAHKTEARLFFIGNMADRLVQSEMEENVHRIALSCPGYMIGQTPEFTTRKIMSMVAPSLEPNETVHFLNFDISAWSPGMRDDIQRLSHEAWAEVFNRSEFLNARMINEGSIVAMNKRGYKGAYINPGANFEGYNGKEMTFLHCALMGYSVYRYRRATNHNLTVSLCAFIDDGLASFRDIKENGSTRFLQFADIVEQTYQSLGFLLEKTKCFLSDRFAIFLNEIYISGRHVTYGLRAIMRVGTKTFDPHETLNARANAYFSGTQGAMRAGLDVLAGFITYLWLIARMLLVFGAVKFLDARAAVLYALTPKGLGGVGCPGFANLVSNLVTDTMVEGVSCMQELVRAYPQYKDKVLSILRQPVAARSATAILVSPTTVSDTVAPMLEGRLKNAVAVAIRKAKLAPKARDFVNVSRNSDITPLAEAILGSTGHVVPALMKDLLDATPFALFVALLKKFESSRTMVALVGRKKMAHIVRQNRNDAIQSMRAFVRR